MTRRWPQLGLPLLTKELIEQAAQRRREWLMVSLRRWEQAAYRTARAALETLLQQQQARQQPEEGD